MTQPRQEPPELSVVVPLYNEEESLSQLAEQILAVVRPLGLDFELVLVDDGSKDNTPNLLSGLAAQVPELVAVLLRRNYGQTAAMAAGLSQTLVWLALRTRVNCCYVAGPCDAIYTAKRGLNHAQYSHPPTWGARSSPPHGRSKTIVHLPRLPYSSKSSLVGKSYQKEVSKHSAWIHSPIENSVALKYADDA